MLISKQNTVFFWALFMNIIYHKIPNFFIFFRHHDIRNINVGLCMDDFGDCRDNGEKDCKGQGKGSCQCRTSFVNAYIKCRPSLVIALHTVYTIYANNNCACL